MITENPPSASPSHEVADSHARTALVCGVVGVVGLFVPPGLFVSPLAAVAAVVLGLTAPNSSARGHRDAFTGVVLGVVTLVAWAAIVFTFRHLIGRVLSDINLGH